MELHDGGLDSNDDVDDSDDEVGHSSSEEEDALQRASELLAYWQRQVS